MHVTQQCFLFTLQQEVTDRMVQLRKWLPHRAQYRQSQLVLFGQNLLKGCAGITQLVYRLATGWIVRGSNPSGGGDDFSATFQTGPEGYPAS